MEIDDKVLKAKLRICESFEEANSIVEQYAETFKDKIAFLNILFPDISILDPYTHDNSSIETDYQVLIHTIINN